MEKKTFFSDYGMRDKINFFLAKFLDIFVLLHTKGDIKFAFSNYIWNNQMFSKQTWKKEKLLLHQTLEKWRASRQEEV